MARPAEPDASFWRRRALTILVAALPALALLDLVLIATAFAAHSGFLSMADYAGIRETAPFPMRLAVMFRAWVTRLLLPGFVSLAVLAVISQGGLLLRSAGLRVQREGVESPHTRRVLRLMLMLMLLPLLVLAIPGWKLLGLPPYDTLVLLGTVSMAYLACAGYAMRHPHRGVPDRLAGTSLVAAGERGVARDRAVRGAGFLAGLCWMASLAGATLVLPQAPLTNRLQIDRRNLDVIPITPEITYLTGPLAEDGLPDYSAGFNARYAIPPEANAIVPLLSFFEESTRWLSLAGATADDESIPVSRVEEFPKRARWPWLPIDDDASIAWLQANARLLDEAVLRAREAAEREGFWGARCRGRLVGRTPPCMDLLSWVRSRAHLAGHAPAARRASRRGGRRSE